MNISAIENLYANLSIWVFPKIGVFPPNHPLKNKVFHEINPFILGVFPLFLVQHPYTPG